MSKKLEDLPPLSLQISELLSRRAADLLNLIKIKEHALKNAPAGSVRIVQRRNNVLQFYRKQEAGDYQGTYMPREDDVLARRLVQKDYDQRVLEKAKHELRLIENFTTTLEKNSTDTVLDSLDEKRKSLIKPATLTEAQYAELWQNQPYRKKKIEDTNHKLITDNGEFVRSKSEIIIANALKSQNVPYRYEFPLVIETAYAERAVERLAFYSANGYFPGKNLIITMESKNSSVNSQEINRIINEYLK